MTWVRSWQATFFLVGSYYAQYFAGEPFPDDRPEAAVEPALTSLAEATL
jgi:hypothetical protein